VTEKLHFWPGESVAPLQVSKLKEPLLPNKIKAALLRTGPDCEIEMEPLPPVFISVKFAIPGSAPGKKYGGNPSTWTTEAGLSAFSEMVCPAGGLE
jgi:hypothetical protein